MEITLFNDVIAKTLTPQSRSWSELVETCKNPTIYPSKRDMPLIKLAKFGDKRSASGSLRHDGNIVSVSGIEGDYDAGVMQPDAAAFMLEAYGISGTIYTTPRHTPEKPRWRVILPLSKDCPPQCRLEFTAALNGVLGGVLAPESFTLSQTYYFGAVVGTAYECFVVEGQPIDLAQGLPKIYLDSGKPCTVKPVHDAGTVDGVTLNELREALTYIDSNDRDGWVKVGQALRSLGDIGYELWDKWSQRSEKYNAHDMPRRWEGFKSERTGYQAVFAKAQASGWVNPRAGRTVDTAAVFSGNQLPAPPTEPSESPTTLKDKLIPLTVFGESAYIPHIIDHWLPVNEVTLLASHGGSGKSYIALLIGVYVALGKQIAGLNVKQSRVLFFSAEDSGQVLRHRLQRICSTLDISTDSLKDSLYLLDASDIDAALHREQKTVVHGTQWVKTETQTLAELAKLVVEHDPGLIIVDNASDTFDDNEITRARVRAFIKSLRSRLARPGRAVLLLAHVNKQSASSRDALKEDYSGSTAWHNSVRSRLSLISDTGVIRIEHLKANLGAKAQPVVFNWHKCGAPTVSNACVVQDHEQKRQQDEAYKLEILKVIKDFEGRGEHVTTSHQGSTTCFHLIGAMVGFKDKSDKVRFADLVRELERENKIYRTSVKTPQRKDKEVFCCSAHILTN